MSAIEIISPGDDRVIQIDAMMNALDENDRLKLLLNKTNAELISVFDTLGYTMKRLGLLKDSTFWQKEGPINPKDKLSKIHNDGGES